MAAPASSWSPRAAPGGEAPTQVGVGHHLGEGAGQEVRAVRRHHQALLAGGHELGDAAHVGGHHGDPQRQGLHQGHREALVVRGEAEHVAARHDPGGVGPIAEEPEVVAQPGGVPEPFELGEQRALAHRDEPRFGVLADHRRWRRR